MAASVKIEFDDGSRVISQTLEDAADVVDPRSGGGVVLSVGKRPSSCSIDDFYEVRQDRPAIQKIDPFSHDL